MEIIRDTVRIFIDSVEKGDPELSIHSGPQPRGCGHTTTIKLDIAEMSLDTGRFLRVWKQALEQPDEPPEIIHPRLTIRRTSTTPEKVCVSITCTITYEGRVAVISRSATYNHQEISSVLEHLTAQKKTELIEQNR